MVIMGCDLVVVSEGLFGLYFVIGFLFCDEELLFLWDWKNNFEIVVKELSIKMNFFGEDCVMLNEVRVFVDWVCFLLYGLVLKDCLGCIKVKGFVYWNDLEKVFNEMIF